MAAISANQQSGIGGEAHQADNSSRPAHREPNVLYLSAELAHLETLHHPSAVLAIEAEMIN